MEKLNIPYFAIFPKFFLGISNITWGLHCDIYTGYFEQVHPLRIYFLIFVFVMDGIKM
jgi:hypothetical protein